MGRIAGRFARVEPRRRARAFVLGLLAGLPRKKSWTADPGRCRAAGIPASVRFATKPALAGRMIAWALDAGVRAAWVTGDSVYGADSRLRRDLEGRRVGYVLGVACDHKIITAAGMRRADELAAGLPPAA